MAKVEVYVSGFCPYCVAAKRLLDKKGVAFEEIDISGDHDRRLWLAKASGQRTVPQIFIDGKPYGGYSDIATLDRRGELDALLAG